MALLKYFKKVSSSTSGDSYIGMEKYLPNPNGELARVMPSSTIQSANVAMSKALKKFVRSVEIINTTLQKRRCK